MKWVGSLESQSLRTNRDPPSSNTKHQQHLLSSPRADISGCVSIVTTSHCSRCWLYIWRRSDMSMKWVSMSIITTHTVSYSWEVIANLNSQREYINIRLGLHPMTCSCCSCSRCWNTLYIQTMITLLSTCVFPFASLLTLRGKCEAWGQRFQFQAPAIDISNI